MIGRYILPWFGGGPAVWSTCLLFFQACLLAGYAYAHWLGSLANVRVQAGIHCGLLLASLAFLPLHPNAAIWKPVSAADPSGRILLLLTVAVGGPYLLLSATAPLVQRWFTLDNPRKVALAIVCSFEFRIVSGLVELSVRLRAVAAAAHAGFHLVGVVPGVRGALRIRRLALALRQSSATNPHRPISNPRRVPPPGRCSSGWGFPPAAQRCCSPPPIKSRKTSPSVPSCGWQRLRSTCSHSCWPLKATASTGERLFAIAAGAFRSRGLRASHRVDRAFVAIAANGVSDGAVRHLHDLPGRTGAIPSVAPLSHHLLFDHRRRRRPGRCFRRPRRATIVHRIQ